MTYQARGIEHFQAALARQDYSSRPGGPNYIPPESLKKKRPKSNVVYSQPADTGTGVNVNTQLLYAVNHLKSVNGPMRLQDLALMTNTPLNEDGLLLEKFRAHDRVIHDPKTDLYSYKHDFNFRNKAQLLTEIQRHTRHGGGMSMKLLKECWKEAPQAVEELEKEGEILVTRTMKDGQPKMVFWNEIKPNEESGGVRVEQEFLDLWHGLKVPNDVDLVKALASEGLQLTTSEAVVPKGPNTKKKGKRSAPKHRQSKWTNTHLRGEIDLTRDYAPPGASK